MTSETLKWLNYFIISNIKNIMELQGKLYKARNPMGWIIIFKDIKISGSYTEDTVRKYNLSTGNQNINEWFKIHRKTAETSMPRFGPFLYNIEYSFPYVLLSFLPDLNDVSLHHGYDENNVHILSSLFKFWRYLNNFPPQ
ncbi:hypothetical protein PV326_004476 [Microctonus aethiopoides]|nr:hypothetical protein PV326_004476 [Microctonus aethiopoides]